MAACLLPCIEPNEPSSLLLMSTSSAPFPRRASSPLDVRLKDPGRAPCRPGSLD
jgi:hypothetical protein